MDEYYFSVTIDENRKLCIAPLTDRGIELSGQDPNTASGYFLFERNAGDELHSLEVIAHIASEDAALRLREMFDMA